MKNVLLGINVILIVLVGFLYYKVFSNQPEQAKAKANSEKTAELSSDNSSRVAYIDLDSLQAHYKYYQIIKADFEKKQNTANNEIINLQKKYQTRTTQLQQQASSMTPEQQEKAMIEINKMQQDFQNRKEALDKDLFDYNTKMKDDIMEKIETFLKSYNKDGRFSYIFSYEPGFMFYKDSTLNITNDVVEGLNKNFNDQKK